MITVQPSIDIEKSAGLVSQAARIKICPEAFMLLSSGLYTNKVMAWIRESYTNAFDAHVAAGTQHIPIEVHVPTRLEPHFSVKDFGTGLSHEDMMEIYTTYFESTKNTSNLEHGGFGLGSKAGLCYNSSFMVSSRFNGIIRSYTVFFDESNIPSISLMGEQPTDEPNGIEVSGSVKVEDCFKFQCEMEEFFARVSPLPKFTGHALVPDTIEYRPISGTGWKIRSEGSGIRVNMGIVSYPVSLPSIVGVDSIAGLPLELTCDIGEVAVTVSRESLSLTPQSIANLTKRLQTVKSELEQYISARMAGCKNLWQARMLMMQYQHGEFSFLSSFFRNMKLLWNGQPVTVNDIKLDNSVSDCTEYNSYRRGIRSEKTNEIGVSPHVGIFINDIGRGAISRAKNALRENSNKYKVVYLISLLNPNDDSELIKTLGMEGDTLPRVSSLPKPNRITGTASDKGRAQVLELANLENGYDCSAWDIVDDFDIDAGGIYVPLKGYKMDDMHPYDYFRHHNLSNLKSMGVTFDNISVLGLKKRLLDKVKTMPQWVELKDYVVGQAKAKLADPILPDKIADYREYQNSVMTADWLKVLQTAGSTIVDNILAALTKLSDKVNKDRATFKNLAVFDTVAAQFNIQLPAIAPTISVANEIERVFEVCPLVKVLAAEYGSWWGQDIFKKAAPELVKYMEERLTSTNNGVV